MSLTTIFGSAPGRPEENSDKLLDLYWNRAELKKQFASLREEQFQLRDRIKVQEGATARVHQKLEHLEKLLLDPEWVYNVILYYQFRNLNLRCQSELAKFAERLKQRREQRQNSHLLVEWNKIRTQEVAAVERSIGEQRMLVQTLEDQLRAEKHRLQSMSFILRIFRRRSVNAVLDNLAESIEIARHEERDLQTQYDEIQLRQPPDTQGLDVATKRLINFMVLAFSQQLYLCCVDGEIAELAKEADDKSVGAINYGSKKECDALLSNILKCMESLEKVSDFADILRHRAKLIAGKAVFRSDDDSVPVSGSVATVFAIDGNGAVTETDANLVGENYWELSKVLSR